MWWLFQLSVHGLQQAVSRLLWGCFIMVFPAPEALAHRWQLHCISFKGPLAPGSCAPLAERGWLCGVPSWKLLLSFHVFLVFSHVASSAGPCCFLGLCPRSRSAILPQTGCWCQTSLSTSQGLPATPWDQRCFTWALFSRLCRAFRPGHPAVVALVLLHQGQLHQIISKMFSGLRCLILRTIRKPWWNDFGHFCFG